MGNNLGGWYKTGNGNSHTRGLSSNGFLDRYDIFNLYYCSMHNVKVMKRVYYNKIGKCVSYFVKKAEVFMNYVLELWQLSGECLIMAVNSPEAGNLMGYLSCHNH